MDSYQDVHKKLDSYQTALDQYPASATNNGRKIVLEAIKDFERCPCDRHAAVLENYGFSVDHSDRADHAEEYDHNNDPEN